MKYLCETVTEYVAVSKLQLTDCYFAKVFLTKLILMLFAVLRIQGSWQKQRLAAVCRTRDQRWRVPNCCRSRRLCWRLAAFCTATWAQQWCTTRRVRWTSTSCNCVDCSRRPHNDCARWNSQERSSSCCTVDHSSSATCHAAAGLPGRRREAAGGRLHPSLAT